MSKKVRGIHNGPSNQIEGSPPVVENSNLPIMTKTGDPPRRIGGRVLIMKKDPFPLSKRKGKHRMSPLKIEAEALERNDNDYPEQETVEKHEQDSSKKTKSSQSSKQKPEAYLRLTLRIENRKMSIVDAHIVDGPLTIQRKIAGNLVYEVTLGSKQIAVGSIADVGVIRSFPNPQGIPGQEGHYFIDLPSYEFDVRLPRKEISSSTLPKVRITLYRIKSPISKQIEEKPLLTQFENELREVSRMDGISVKNLPKSIQAEISKLFRY